MSFELKKGDKSMNLVNCQVLTTENAMKRITISRVCDKMSKSVRNFNFSKIDDVVAINEAPEFDSQIALKSLSALNVSDVHVYPIENLEKFAYDCFITYCILKKYSDSEITFEEWVHEVASNGYGMWRFSKYPEIVFSDTFMNPIQVKEKFKGKIELSGLESKEHLEAILGAVEGLGCSELLFDNLIKQLGNVKEIKKTRLTTVEQVIENLKNGFWVPMRVDNALCYGDCKRYGTSYIILTGISSGTAFVWSPTEKAFSLPFEILMKAVISYPKYIGIWDLKSLKS